MEISAKLSSEEDGLAFKVLSILIMVSKGTIPEMDWISFSLRFEFLNELAVCNILMLLLKSP